MSSTNHNISNPMEINEIDLVPFLSQLSLPHVITLTLEEYQLMNQHDPFTIYVVIGQAAQTIYRGDQRVITKLFNTYNYLLGIDKKGDNLYYVIYRNINDVIIDICRFTKSEDAIKCLETFNVLGTHKISDYRIFQIIRAFVTNDIGFLAMIIGCLSSVGFRNDPALQELIELQNIHSACCTNEYDVPTYVIQDIASSDKLAHHLYAEIYPILLELINRKALVTDKDLLKRTANAVIKKLYGGCHADKRSDIGYLDV